MNPQLLNSFDPEYLRVLHSDGFHAQYTYHGPLGEWADASGSTAIIWAPTAQRVILEVATREQILDWHRQVSAAGSPGIGTDGCRTSFGAEASAGGSGRTEAFFSTTPVPGARYFPLQAGRRGEWRLFLPEDLRGDWYFRYRLTFPTEIFNPAPPTPPTFTSVGVYTRKVAFAGSWGVFTEAPGRYFTAPESAYAEFGESPGNDSADAKSSATSPREAEAIVSDGGVVASSAVAGSGPVIYELHVRDAGIAYGAGTFRALAEHPVALPHIRDLGVTHLQLLPIFDFGSVDERGDLSFNAQYNWGYDPVNYFAVEGSYGTAEDLKALVGRCRELGLGVVMDVVFNHVYRTGDSSYTSPMALTAPGYYFRYTAEGTPHDATGCGSETADEQPMMQRLIVDCVRYWAEEFQLAGFRFDLMGIHSTHTLNRVRQVVPQALIIGEGWVMGNHPHSITPANYCHAHQLPGISHFNDVLRDALRGNVFDTTQPGYFSGPEVEPAQATDQASDQELRDSLPAETNPTQTNPAQTMRAQSILAELICGGAQHDPKIAPNSAATTSNGAPESEFSSTQSAAVAYVESHDNHTLLDRLSCNVSREVAIELSPIITAVALLANGVVFLHAGQELYRSKGGDENSYASPDSTNAIFWEDTVVCERYVSWVRDLIAFRTAHGPATAATLIGAEPARMHFQLHYSSGARATVIINAQAEPWRIEKPAHTPALSWVDPTGDTRTGRHFTIWLD